MDRSAELTERGLAPRIGRVNENVILLGRKRDVVTDVDRSVVGK